MLHALCTLYTLLIGWDSPTQPITLLAFKTHFYMHYMHYVDYMHYMQYAHYMHPSQVSDWLKLPTTTNQIIGIWHTPLHALNALCMLCVSFAGSWLVEADHYIQSNYWHLTDPHIWVTCIMCIMCITCVMWITCATWNIHITCTFHRILISWGSTPQWIKLLAFDTPPYVCYVHYLHSMHYMHPSQDSVWLRFPTTTNQMTGI